MRLFGLPYAGSGASIFFEWAARLPGPIEVCGIQTPGRENRLAESPYRDCRSLVSNTQRVLLPLLDLPFAIFGHSMGALLGFELAAQLAATGSPRPDHLFVGASRPPHLPNRRGSIHGATDEMLLAEVIRLGGTPAAVLENSELMLFALPTLRADFAVHETYRCEMVLATPITAFCGTTDAEVSANEMAAWGSRTRVGFRLGLIDGDHFFLRTRRDALLDLLAAELEENLATGG